MATWFLGSMSALLGVALIVRRERHLEGLRRTTPNWNSTSETVNRILIWAIGICFLLAGLVIALVGESAFTPLI